MNLCGLVGQKQFLYSGDFTSYLYILYYLLIYTYIFYTYLSLTYLCFNVYIFLTYLFVATDFFLYNGCLGLSAV